MQNEGPIEQYEIREINSQAENCYYFRYVISFIKIMSSFSISKGGPGMEMAMVTSMNNKVWLVKLYK